MTIWQREVGTPLGTMVAATDGVSLTMLDFDRHCSETPGATPGARRVLDDVAAWLDDYFAGGNAPFAHPLAPAGTPFQQSVWNALLGIPYGHTTSYAEIARRIGRPSATRAVGAANGRNPISIVIPCHRVIGANGTLTGYGGGLPRKQALLALEQRASFALVA
jgi:methylated-DNA-[protein]-cysteine S-methyltransferase